MARARARRSRARAPRTWRDRRQARAADLDARYPTADAFAADLVRFLDSQPVSAHRESIAERTWRFARTYRVAILLVAGYLVMRIALLVYRGL